MKTTRRVHITALLVLVAAIAGVVAADGSAARRAARPSIGTVVAKIPTPRTRGRWPWGRGPSGRRAIRCRS